MSWMNSVFDLTTEHRRKFQSCKEWNIKGKTARDVSSCGRNTVLPYDRSSAWPESSPHRDIVTCFLTFDSKWKWGGLASKTLNSEPLHLRARILRFFASNAENKFQSWECNTDRKQRTEGLTFAEELKQQVIKTRYISRVFSSILYKISFPAACCLKNVKFLFRASRCCAHGSHHF